MDCIESESESCSVLSSSLWPHGLYSPWNSPGQNTGVGSLSHFQRIFPTHRSNPGLLHCRWILYQMSHSADQKVCSDFSISYYGKTQTDFLANPIILAPNTFPSLLWPMLVDLSAGWCCRQILRCSCSPQHTVQGGWRTMEAEQTLTEQIQKGGWTMPLSFPTDCKILLQWPVGSAVCPP